MPGQIEFGQLSSDDGEELQQTTLSDVAVAHSKGGEATALIGNQDDDVISDTQP